jgi:hypothetical protein
LGSEPLFEDLKNHQHKHIEVLIKMFRLQNTTGNSGGQEEAEGMRQRGKREQEV